MHSPEYIHNPTYPCTCHIAHSEHLGRHAVTEEIIYCPMHRAAPALLAACEAAFERLTDNDMVGLGSYPLAEQIRAAVTAAKGE